VNRGTPEPKDEALNAAIGLVVWSLACVVLGSALLWMCMSCGPVAVPTACTPEALAKIEGSYLAEAVQLCAGSNYDDCAALPELRRKYDAKREDWIQCSKK